MKRLSALIITLFISAPPIADTLAFIGLLLLAVTLDSRIRPHLHQYRPVHFVNFVHR